MDWTCAQRNHLCRLCQPFFQGTSRASDEIHINGDIAKVCSSRYADHQDVQEELSRYFARDVGIGTDVYKYFSYAKITCVVVLAYRRYWIPSVERVHGHRRKFRASKRDMVVTSSAELFWR